MAVLDGLRLLLPHRTKAEWFPKLQQKPVNPTSPIVRRPRCPACHVLLLRRSWQHCSAAANRLLTTVFHNLGKAGIWLASICLSASPSLPPYPTCKPISPDWTTRCIMPICRRDCSLFHPSGNDREAGIRPSGVFLTLPNAYRATSSSLFTSLSLSLPVKVQAALLRMQMGAGTDETKVSK